MATLTMEPYSSQFPSKVAFREKYPSIYSFHSIIYGTIQFNTDCTCEYA